jgi:hypothetical protein
MPAPLDLDDAVQPRPGGGPVRFLAMTLTMAVRDGADHVFLEPDPTPGVTGALLQYRVGGRLYTLVPPPHRVIRRIAEAVRPFVAWPVGGGEDGWGGWIAARLGGHEFPVWVAVRDSVPGERITLGVPLRPDLADEAGRVLGAFADENGLVEFEDAEFE